MIFSRLSYACLAEQILSVVDYTCTGVTVTQHVGQISNLFFPNLPVVATLIVHWAVSPVKTLMSAQQSCD